MKAMLWKEFRENLKWGLLALVALALAEFYGLNKRDMFNMSLDQAATLCKSSFLMATTFGCAAVGLVLGFVQILPEQRRDQWAALVHRPVDRAVIFRGKAVAGLLLYLLATVPPFLLCVWYVATPGHFAAPFVPKMVYPGVADICAGSMWYFGALFAALRRGPWYGSRIFGLLAALFMSADISMGYTPFHVAVESAVLMALALFTAAWSVMLTNGSFRVQPWLGRFAVLAVAFYGVCGLGYVAQTVLLSVSNQNSYNGTQYIVDVTGRVLKEAYGSDGTQKFYDLAGNQITDKQFTHNTSSRELEFAGISSHVGDAHGGRLYWFQKQYREARTYLVSTNDSPGEIWFYVFPARIFVGYKNQSQVRIGSIGADGFRPGREPVRPLPGAPNIGYQVPRFGQIENTAYFFDFDQRRLTPILSDPTERIFGICAIESRQQNVDVTDLAGVALLHEARIIDSAGRMVATLPYHQDVDRYGELSVAIMPDRAHFFLRYSPSDWINYKDRENMPEYLEEMDVHGALVNSYTLPAIHYPQGEELWWLKMSSGIRSPVYVYGNLAYLEIGAAMGVRHLQRELQLIRSFEQSYYRHMLPQIALVSSILALVTLVWARRNWFSWRRAWAWALFVLGFNLGGLIVFRLCADWPVKVKCPSCARKRPIELETCPACGAPWPAPKREGTEIFTPVEPASAEPAESAV